MFQVACVCVQQAYYKFRVAYLIQCLKLQYILLVRSLCLLIILLLLLKYWYESKLKLVTLCLSGANHFTVSVTVLLILL